MDLMNTLTTKTRSLGSFVGGVDGVKPASVYISFPDVPELAHLNMQPFERSGAEQNKRITFKLPVTPETIKLDNGSDTDKNSIVQTGEVTLPKYKKSVQMRFDSFFPYDYTAPYVNSKSIKDAFRTNTSSLLKSEVKQTWKDYIDSKAPAKPTHYIELFKVSAKMNVPITIAVTYYDGGDIDAMTMTVDAFSSEPESNGDYKYSLSLVEWTDVRPQIEGVINNEPTAAQVLADRLVRAPLPTSPAAGDWWSFCKYWYGSCSAKLLKYVAMYNKIKTVSYFGVIQAIKLKGFFSSFSGKLGIASNMLGKTKITSNDSATVSASIKSIDTSASIKSMAAKIAERKADNLTNL